MSAGHIPNYDAIVEQNSVEVPFVSASFNRSVNYASSGWSIQFEHPLEVDPDDTWTLKRQIGNYIQTLVDDQSADTIGQEDGLSGDRLKAVRSVSGKTASTSLLELCIPKTFVYVNPNWLRGIAPEARIIDDIVQLQWDVSGTGGFSKATGRLYHPRLPNKNLDDDEFVCFFAYDHKQIAQHLADICGYEVVINTPYLSLVDTCTFQKGTTWYDAIVKNFLIYFPDIQIDDDKIYILDLLPSGDQPKSLKTVTFTNRPIITVISDDKNSGRADVKDHLIVKGRSSKSTVSGAPLDLNLTPREIAPVEYTATETLTFVQKISLTANRTSQSPYTGAYGSGGDAFTPENISSVITTKEFHVDDVTRERKLLTETVTSYLASGSIQNRVVREFKYGEHGRPIYTIEAESARVPYPGSASRQFTAIREKISSQNHYIQSINATLTNELITELVLYTLDDSDRLDPIPLTRLVKSDPARTAVDSDVNTDQEVDWAVTHQRWSQFDRVDKDTLIQAIFDYDVLTGVITPQYQILDNPNKDDPITEEIPFQQDFHPDGAGTVLGAYTCYHAPVTIQHDDIITTDQMQEIADRYFSTNSARNVKLRIQTPVTIPFESLGYVLSLPAFTYDVNGASVEVPAGTYLLTDVAEQLGWSGTKIRSSQEIICRSAF